MKSNFKSIVLCFILALSLFTYGCAGAIGAVAGYGLNALATTGSSLATAAKGKCQACHELLKSNPAAKGLKCDR